MSDETLCPKCKKWGFRREDHNECYVCSWMDCNHTDEEFYHTVVWLEKKVRQVENELAVVKHIQKTLRPVY